MGVGLSAMYLHDRKWIPYYYLLDKTILPNIWISLLCNGVFSLCFELWQL